MRVPYSLVALIGPGGAGKSTIGASVAERLGIAFVDLDRRFSDRFGDISDCINRFGYDAYAGKNVEIFRSTLCEENHSRVIALSSGFMTYRPSIHPEYTRLRGSVEENPTTFVLIPSLNREVCIAETVCRQLERPFAWSADSEAAVIRERFAMYAGLRARKMETMRPLNEVVDELARLIRDDRVLK